MVQKRKGAPSKGSSSTENLSTKEGKKNGRLKQEIRSDDSKTSQWSILGIFNITLGIIAMVAMGYYHYEYMKRIHENNMWFTNIKEVEREISFRTEMGLYYSYYKQLTASPSFWDGLQNLTKDKLTEHPDTINILARMNIYQEVFLAGIHRAFGVQMAPIFFYIYSVYVLHALLVCALFSMAWLLSGSWLAGILAAAFYNFNRMDTTRVCHTGPLRENFALPFLWVQLTGITVYFMRSTTCSAKIRVSQVAIFIGTLLFCLFWQFNQFVMMLQGFALFGVWVLGIIPAEKVRFVVICQQAALAIVCLMQFGNPMLVSSLSVTFNIGFLILLRGETNEKQMTKTQQLKRVCSLSALVLVVMFLTSFILKKVLSVDSDEHIFKFLQNKFGVGNEKDFDSRLYLCLGIFQVVGFEIFIRLLKGFVLPPYIIGHLKFLIDVVLAVLRRWNVLSKIEDKSAGIKDNISEVSSLDEVSSPEMSFHAIQSVFFMALGIMTERMKYMWTPYICVLAAVWICDTSIWKRLQKSGMLPKGYKPIYMANAVASLFLAVMLAILLPPALAELEELREFYDPDTVELMEWIVGNTASGAAFTGSMQLLAAVKLSTLRPITNHPHYEDKHLRHKTKQLYQIYAKREPVDVHAILKKYDSSFIIMEDSICRAPARGDGCRMTDKMDLDNGVQPDDPLVKMPGLVPPTSPSFCEHVRHQQPPYSQYFKSVFINKTFRIYKVL